MLWHTLAIPLLVSMRGREGVQGAVAEVAINVMEQGRQLVEVRF